MNQRDHCSERRNNSHSNAEGLRSTQHWVGAEKLLCSGLPGSDILLCLKCSPPASVQPIPEEKEQGFHRKLDCKITFKWWGFLGAGVPEVWWNEAHPLTGLSVVSSGLWASVLPEKHLRTGNVLWRSSGLVCTRTHKRSDCNIGS